MIWIAPFERDTGTETLEEPPVGGRSTSRELRLDIRRMFNDPNDRVEHRGATAFEAQAGKASCRSVTSGVCASMGPIAMEAGVCSRWRSQAPGETAVDTKAHWEKVYSTKHSDEVSWYQANPAPSLRLLDHARIRSDT
jgi:hypothetical protein